MGDLQAGVRLSDKRREREEGKIVNAFKAILLFWGDNFRKYPLKKGIREEGWTPAVTGLLNIQTHVIEFLFMQKVFQVMVKNPLLFKLSILSDNRVLSP